MSDDPQKVSSEARSRRVAAGRRQIALAGGGAGPGRGHGHGGGSGGGERGGPGDQARQDMSDWFAALKTLEIRHEEPILTVTDAAGTTSTSLVRTDARPRKSDHGGTTVVTAFWKDGHIQVVSVPETGPRTTETYSITADGSQLTVTTKIEGGRRPAITIRRVYDAVRPGAPKAPPSISSPAPAPGQTPSGGAEEDQSV